jgi:hypothetical protein
MEADAAKHVDESVRQWLPSILDGYGFKHDAANLRNLAPLVDEPSLKVALLIVREVFLGSSKMISTTPLDSDRKAALEMIRWSAMAVTACTVGFIQKVRVLN